jgi:hypothetical protein
MKSRLAEQARQERLDQERHLTPEQRVLAFVHHGRLGRHVALTLEAFLS